MYYMLSTSGRADILLIMIYCKNNSRLFESTYYVPAGAIPEMLFISSSGQPYKAGTSKFH